MSTRMSEKKVLRENLLENYGEAAEALESPPISVESDGQNDTDIFQAIPQEETNTSTE